MNFQKPIVPRGLLQQMVRPLNDTPSSHTTHTTRTLCPTNTHLHYDNTHIHRTPPVNSTPTSRSAILASAAERLRYADAAALSVSALSRTTRIYPQGILYFLNTLPQISS